MDVTRRDVMRYVVGAGVGALAASINRRVAWAEDPNALPNPGFDTQPISLDKLTDAVRVIAGPGGNVMAVVGDGPTVVVDSGVASRGKDVLAAVKGLSGRPVGTLINTHWHFDHAGGNAAFGEAGAKIVAHAKTRQRLSTRQTIAFFGMSFDPSPAAALPVETFDDGLTLYANGEKINAFHLEPAHTDTDVALFLENADVLHTGDVFFNGFYPFIDYSTGGSIEGMIAGCDRLLKVAQAKTRVIPGHGPVGTRADLQKFRDMLAEVKGRIEPLVKQGLDAKEVEEKNLLADLDPVWGQRLFHGRQFVRLVYAGMAKKMN